MNKKKYVSLTVDSQTSQLVHMRMLEIKSSQQRPAIYIISCIILALPGFNSEIKLPSCDVVLEKDGLQWAVFPQLKNKFPGMNSEISRNLSQFPETEELTVCLLDARQKKKKKKKITICTS